MNIKEDLSLIKAAIESFPNEQIGITFTIPETDAQHIYPIELNAETAPQFIEWLQETFKVEPNPNTKFGAEWCLQDIIQRGWEDHNLIIAPTHALEIANYIESIHDATVGINWDVIDEAIIHFITHIES